MGVLGGVEVTVGAGLEEGAGGWLAASIAGCAALAIGDDPLAGRVELLGVGSVGNAASDVMGADGTGGGMIITYCFYFNYTSNIN